MENNYFYDKTCINIIVHYLQFCERSQNIFSIFFRNKKRSTFPPRAYYMYRVYRMVFCSFSDRFIFIITPQNVVWSNKIEPIKTVLWARVTLHPVRRSVWRLNENRWTRIHVCVCDPTHCIYNRTE